MCVVFQPETAYEAYWGELVVFLEQIPFVWNPQTYRESVT